MAYGQKNYADIQGIGGKYRISQIGCFLTAFCNLLQRFGRPVDPPTLNRIFRDRGIFIDVDDGIRDDLGWQSIVAYDGRVALQRSGTTAIPPHRDSIVRIKANNSFGTHFCLVDRIEGGTVYIVDSWDGAVKKSSAYGPITGWAAYGNIVPQPVQPVPVKGGDMPVTLDAAKVIANAFAGRDPNNPDNINDLNKHHVGKDPVQDVMAWHNSPEGTNFRNFRDQAINFYRQYQGAISELTARPSREELEQKIKQLNEFSTKVTELEEKLKLEELDDAELERLAQEAQANAEKARQELEAEQQKPDVVVGPNPPVEPGRNIYVELFNKIRDGIQQILAKFRKK